MYKPLQKKSSSWASASIQKKSKNFSKPGHSAIQQKPNSQEIPNYSTTAADLLVANVMRSLENKEQEQAETSTVQPQSPEVGAAFALIAPPMPLAPSPQGTKPVVQLKIAGRERLCSKCASSEQEQLEEDGKDVDEMSSSASRIQTQLTVGTPGDNYEQEADRVATQVMSMSAAPESSPQVQRFEEDKPIQRWFRPLSITSLSQTISRKPDVYTEWLNQQANVIRSGLDAGTREGMHQAFDRLNSLNMQNMLDVLVLLQQQKLLPELRTLLPECGLGEAAINRMTIAMDSVEQVSSHELSKLPPDQKKTVEAFGKAPPGASGDDPDRNTYVVYDGFIKTYFMTSVERKRRSSAWLANNPGNMDRTGDVVGIGKGMKWGNHTFAIFTTLDDGKAALRDHLLRYQTLDSYLNFHLGIRADGSNKDGNNKTIYLQDIHAKAKFATASTNPQLLEAGQMNELLEGFYHAEGSSRPGNILTASNATIDESMNPIQKKCMRFYQALLGLRTPEI